MFLDFADSQFNRYEFARDFFLNHPETLKEAERYILNCITETLYDFRDEFKQDYNEASYLYPFWGSYPPAERGNKPVGDQVPWIEVGEHSVGHRIERLMGSRFNIREIGMPSGTDDRFILSNSRLKDILKITSSAMVFLDVKSTGPRDSHTDLVVSPYQVSGDGIWNELDNRIENSVVKANGKLKEASFQPSISPVLCLSDGTIAPLVHIFLKTIYSMQQSEDGITQGQPLESVIAACVPNGLQLFVNPNYNASYRGLLRPGKDDKKKGLDKRRVRVDLETLKQVDEWRVCKVDMGD